MKGITFSRPDCPHLSGKLKFLITAPHLLHAYNIMKKNTNIYRIKKENITLIHTLAGPQHFSCLLIGSASSLIHKLSTLLPLLGFHSLWK